VKSFLLLHKGVFKANNLIRLMVEEKKYDVLKKVANSNLF
jgi:hypothetical protein